jgi:uncharacterized protein YcbK (DUF882 family)
LARIETYERRIGPQRTNTPSAQLSTAASQALEGVGAAVQDVAATFQQRAEQRENFTAENDFRRFKLGLQNELETRAQKIEPGGLGFHEGFVAEVYRPKRDEFLSKVPERLKPKFEEMLADETGAEFASWDIAAATVERDESYRWQKEEIGSAHEELATAIAMNPDAYDALLTDGQNLINASSLPTPERERLSTLWEETAQVAILNEMLRTDPEGVIRELGGDSRNLSPTTQFAMLSRAVQWQESRDNPNAVSGKGAVGLMQVMPATAVEIAGELGDESFPKDAPEAAIRAYLSNPAVNKRYGEHYLQKQLRAFANTRDPIESALVAYNAGASVAQKWVESGYNDKVLPKETRDYKRAIMATLKSPAAKGAAKDIIWEGVKVDKTNPDLVGRVADAYATLGLKKVRVNSAERSATKNKQVGGADKSQHLDANALDLNVAGMSIPQKIELIKALSAAGVTGIGIYGNAIHADLGGRRAWGPDYGSGSVPKWASGVIAEHLNGTTPPPRAVNSRYASLSYDKSQAFLSKADQEIARQHAAAAKSSAVEKVQVKNAMENELALIRATGQTSGIFDETDISTILGEDDYLTFSQKKAVAQQTFTATSGIATMAPEDMEQRFSEYDPIPGSANFAAQQEVQAAVRKEIDRVTRLRSNSPDRAALEYPEVRAAYEQLAQADAAGTAIEPTQVQNFVQLMLEKQASFDIKPEARAPIPHDWALDIGRVLAQVPQAQGRNMADVQAAIVQTYRGLEATFGEYTDEVLTYALSEYTGLDKGKAELLTKMVTAFQTGSGPFRAVDVDTIEDQGQVERFLMPAPFQMLQPITDLLGGASGATEEDGLSPEEQLRAADAAEDE